MSQSTPISTRTPTPFPDPTISRAERCAGRGRLLLVNLDTPAGAMRRHRGSEPVRDRGQFGWGRAVEIGAAEAGDAHEATVLVEDDAGRDQRSPGQEVREARGAARIFAKEHHGFSFRRQWEARCGGARR